jgi:hypothetical protein
MIISSIVCKKCKNDLWKNEYDGFLHCTNCSFKRKYIKHEPRTDSITKSQKQQIKAITHYFDGSQYSTDGQPTKKIALAKYELKYAGKLYFTIETEGGLWVKDGGSFLIGRRGGLTVLSTARFDSDYDSDIKHLAKILGGKTVLIKCTTKEKIEIWLRENGRTDFNYYNQYTLFTAKKLSEILGLKVSSTRSVLVNLEKSNQVTRYGRLKDGITWENKVKI